MSMSFRDFMKFLFHRKGEFSHDDRINRSIYASTLNKMCIVATLSALLGITAGIASFTPAHSAAEYIVEYRWVYFSLVAIMAGALLLFSFVRRDLDRRSRALIWIMPFTSAYVLLWAILATSLNAFSLGFVNPSLYIAVSMTIPFCSYMHPVVYLLVEVTADVVMLIVYSNLQHHVPAPSPLPVVLAAILGIRLVSGLLIYFLQFTIWDNSITFEEQQKEIRDLNNAQNRFFSSMSHEIRTPINTIIGFNEMILREKVSDEVAEDAENIRSASNMLLHLINDILDMSRLSSGQMKLTPASYNPVDMLSEIAAMLWPRSREKGLDFYVQLSPDIPSGLYADDVRLRQILINVLNNAIKYTGKGSVTLSVQCSGITDNVADIIYSVTDTGMGIRKESLPYLFTAFKRVDEEKNRLIEGTGLGLSIVKELTELMGGKVSVNSIYTQGSTFVIEIPQTVTDPTRIGNVNLEEKQKTNLSGKYRSIFEAPEARVLVVDDSRSNLLVMQKLLRDTKVMLDTADSGAAALDRTLAQSYDLILMDHLMPEMDGIECFHRIKNQTGGLCKSSAFIALTANAGSEMKKLYADEGFDGYIVKPVNTAELESELVRLLPQELVRMTGSSDNIVEKSKSWIDAKGSKKSIMITTESLADIPESLIDQYGIKIIPHKVETNEGIFSDGEEIDSDGLLDYMKDEKAVMTHAPSVKEHEVFFADALSYAHNVIHITLSSKVHHSGFDRVTDGAAAFNNVTVFDSCHLSSGQGILALSACRLASDGMSVEEITEKLTEIRKTIHTSFISDNLDYLARNRHVTTSVARIGKSMMLHPVIEMRNGRMTLRKFYFGSRKRAWNKYINSTLRSVTDIDKSELFITYVGLSQSDLDQIRELVAKKAQFEHVYLQKASPTIAVNSGPGTFGLLFRRKKT